MCVYCGGSLQEAVMDYAEKIEKKIFILLL